MQYGKGAILKKNNDKENREYDDKLITRLRDGEEEMFPILLERYKGLVKSEAKKLFIQGGDHDDLIQEGMIGLMKAVKGYQIEGEASFRTFSRVCVSRQMYTAVEAAARKKHQPLNSYVSIHGEEDETKQCEEVGSTMFTTQNNVNPEKIYFGRENQEQFTGLLVQKLSSLEKAVLLHHIMGMDYKEIANELEKEPKAIDNALQRIKSKARSVLDKSE